MKQKNIIIAGIHTDVGKSVVAGIVTEALSGYYWKPVQCGKKLDRKWVEARLSIKQSFVENFCFSTPCSPHLAARRENLHIDKRKFVLPNCKGYLIIEGTGGLLAPLNEKETWADAAMHWEAKWILVHRHYLGSLNHFLLTIEAMRMRNLPLVGVVFNNLGDFATEQMLLEKANTICLGRLTWEKNLSAKKLQEIAQEWKQRIYAAVNGS